MLVGLPNPGMNLFGRVWQVQEWCYCLGGTDRYAGPRGMDRCLAGLDGWEGNLSRGDRRRGLAVAQAL